MSGLLELAPKENNFVVRNIVEKYDLSLPLEKSAIRLGTLLISEGLITGEQLDKALEMQKTGSPRKIGEILVEMGVIDEEEIYKSLSMKLGIPFLKLGKGVIDSKAVTEIPMSFAKSKQIIPIGFNKNRLVVAVASPLIGEVLDELSFITNRGIDLVMASASDIEKAISHHFDGASYIEWTEESGRQFELESSSVQAKEKATVNLEGHTQQYMEKIASERPIVKLVNQIFIDATRKGASDIHIRPNFDSIDLLYRIDGSMIRMKSYKKSLLSAIISRIKVLSTMDVTERRLPQGGQLSIRVDGELRDMRVSTIPSTHGESAVIRLLSRSSGLKPVEELGFDAVDTGRFKEVLKRSAGVVLVTGPTGSGKSTTLYSAVGELKRSNANIISVEDPVEIRISGITQIGVRNECGFTFIKALRSILRHDPDIIMLGEIRDAESSNICFQSAQTGHLVLSTLHTNTAAGTIARLQQMGTERYLVAASTLAIIAQRLLRKNCTECLAEEAVENISRQTLGLGANEKFYRGKGCSACNDTGYAGRIPVYELLVLNKDIRELILANGSTAAIQQAAVDAGMTSILDNALQKARAGETSIEEVHKVYLP